MSNATKVLTKKLHSTAIDLIINELIMAKNGNGRNDHKKYNNNLNALHNLGVDMTIDAVYKRVEREYKKRKIPSEVVVRKDAFSLQSILAGDSHKSSSSGSQGSIATTKRFSGCPKGTTEEKKRQDKKQYNDCVSSICDVYANELTKSKGKHMHKHFLDGLIQTKQLEFDITQNIS